MAIKKFIGDMGLWFVWVPLRRVIQWLPLKVSYALSGLCADIFFLIAAGKKKIMSAELKIIFKDKTPGQLNQIVRQSFEVYLKRQAENLIYGSFNKEKLAQIVSVEGRENLDTALSCGKGVIILLSHFGSFMMVLPALGYMGYRINQLAGPPLFERLGLIHKKIFIIRKRASDKLPVNFLQSDKSLFAALRVLKKNECVAIAFDGRAGDKWISVKMFGRKALISPGPVRIAMKTGSIIVPTFIVRQADDTHRLILERPFELTHFKNSEAMISENTQNLANTFEKYIEKFPSHYGMTLLAMRERVAKGIIDFSLLPQAETENV